MTISKERLDELRKLRDEDIDYSDIPELDDSFWENAVLTIPVKKKVVSLRIDQDVLDWFKADGRGYQTRMNAVLRSYMEAKKTSG